MFLNLVHCDFEQIILCFIILKSGSNTTVLGCCKWKRDDMQYRAPAEHSRNICPFLPCCCLNFYFLPWHSTSLSFFFLAELSITSLHRAQLPCLWVLIAFAFPPINEASRPGSLLIFRGTTVWQTISGAVCRLPNEPSSFTSLTVQLI